MGWREPRHRAGDLPDPEFGPPRHGAHRDADSNDGVPHVPPGTDGTPRPRDERLAGFAADGARVSRPPSAELADLLESLSGPEWRCPGATDDEIVGMVGRWAAIESWAGAAKLGAIRELIRHEDKPWQPADRNVDEPDAWSESLTAELALALAASAGSADRTAWLAWELGTRLPGIDALLTDGTLTYGKAKAIAEAFKHLTDENAAHAESLILGKLKGKTYQQVLRLAAAAASRVDPDGDERRRKKAVKESARVRLWREQSGAAALAGFDLPPDEALAAHANVCARAEQYESSAAFPGAQMEQLRAMAYLDLLNSVTAETRIANARARAAEGDNGGNSPASGPIQEDEGPVDGPAAGPGDNGAPNNGPGAGPDDDGGNPGGGAPDPRQPAGPSPSPNAAARPRTDLVIPLATLLGLGNRPGESHRFGPLDPALCRDLAAIAANSSASKLCVTVTDPEGYAIGHGCARMPRTPGQTRQASQDPRRGSAALPARLNLTVPLTDLQNLARSDNVSRGSPWAFTPHADTGPPGGYGHWTLTIPGGREFTVRLEPVPTFACDHAHESHAYQPNDTLRHLVRVRDGDCTFPPCSRHARESDFEHAIPYDKGGRTCACNAGARSRRCHRIKQSSRWQVTQPKPGFHQWTTPTGRTYTQEPKHYPA